MRGLRHCVREDLAALSVAAERRRVLAELHDVIGQELTLLALECDIALAADPGGPSAPGLRRIRWCANRLVQSVGDLAEGVQPVSLRDCLDRARRDLMLAGIELRLDLPAGFAGLPAQADALLGYVVREGVTNVLRHAPAATTCEISVRMAGGVVLVVRNDGVIGTGPGRPGVGIAGLRDRAASLGARIEITTSADTFALAAHLPPGRPSSRVTALSVLGG